MSGGIFVNYRRGDDPGFTGRLFDQLTSSFPRDMLFMDVDGIAPGADFTEVLKREVDKCDVLLAVVGRHWLESADAAGRRRLDDPDDFVRIEIAAALASGKLVVPVLVNGAEMPASSKLPDDIKAFSMRNAVRLTHERFHADTKGLIKSLAAAVADADAKRAAAAARQARDEAARRKAEKDAARERQRQAAKERQADGAAGTAGSAGAGPLLGLSRSWLLFAAGAVVVSAIAVVGMARNSGSSAVSVAPRSTAYDTGTGYSGSGQTDCESGNNASSVVCQIQRDVAKSRAERDRSMTDMERKLFGITNEK